MGVTALLVDPSNFDLQTPSCGSSRGMLFPPTPEVKTPCWVPPAVAMGLPTLLSRGEGVKAGETMNATDGDGKIGAIASNCFDGGKAAELKSSVASPRPSMDAKQFE